MMAKVQVIMSFHVKYLLSFAEILDVAFYLNLLKNIF